MVHQQDAATHSSNPASGDDGAAAHSFWQSEQIVNRVDPYNPKSMGIFWSRTTRTSSATRERTLGTASIYHSTWSSLGVADRVRTCEGYIHAGAAAHEGRFAPRGVAIERNVPANVREQRPLVPATDIDDGWSGWRISGTESGRGSCVLLHSTVLYAGDSRGGTRLFEVIKLCRSGSGCQRAPANVGWDWEKGCSAR